MTEQRIMNNGIRVVMEKMPTYRSVSLGIWVKTGSMYENKKNNGMAHVLEHMMFKGTTHRTAEEIADQMTALGGNMDAFTCKDCTCYYAKTLDIYAKEAIDILGDMIRNSLFDRDELRKELGVILEEIDMYEDSPEDLVHEHLQMEVWKDHPLGYLISGEKQTVSHFTREQVLEFYNQFYVGENIVISAAGHFDSDQMFEWLCKAFEDIPKGSRSVLGDAPEYNPILWSRRKDIEQNHMCIAYNCCSTLSEERYPLTVANNILGGNMNSRLFMKIRDDLGMTYSIYSYGSSYEQAGLFQIYAAMQPSQTDQVLEEIFKVVEHFKKNGVTEKELQIAIQQIQAELIMGYESSYNRMNGMGKSLLIRDRVISLEEDLDKIRRVTREDIQNLCEKYFIRDLSSISLVGEI